MYVSECMQLICSKGIYTRFCLHGPRYSTLLYAHLSDSFMYLDRMERHYTHAFYELHRRDAVAMERLTTSPYIVDIFGVCGPSAINEFADSVEGIRDVEDFSKKMEGKNSDEVLRLKLKIAAMIATGVQHIHEIDGINNATMVHYDLNPTNVAMTSGYIPKLNDFNVGEFLQWDNVKNNHIPFVGHLYAPWWRAPEEMQEHSLLDGTLLENIYYFCRDSFQFCFIFSSCLYPIIFHATIRTNAEKVDIYSLGNILYYILTGSGPRGAQTKERFDKVRKNVGNGEPPNIPSKYKDSTNPIIKAFIVAIEHCYIVDPKERSSARDIASELHRALSQIEKKVDINVNEKI